MSIFLNIFLSLYLFMSVFLSNNLLILPSICLSVCLSIVLITYGVATNELPPHHSALFLNTASYSTHDVPPTTHLYLEARAGLYLSIPAFHLILHLPLPISLRCHKPSLQLPGSPYSVYSNHHTEFLMTLQCFRILHIT